MRKKGLFLFISALTFLSATAQIKVYTPTESASIKQGEGGYYCLPKTKLSVHVAYSKKEYKKSGLYDKLWLDSNQEKLKAYIDYKIVATLEKTAETIFCKLPDESLTITTEPVPDLEKVYFVQVRGRPTKQTSLKLTYGPDYIINTIGQEIEDKTFETVVKAVGLLSDIASIVFNPISALDEVVVGYSPSRSQQTPLSKEQKKAREDSIQRSKLLFVLTKLETREKELMSGEVPLDSPDMLDKYIDNIKVLKKRIVALLSYDYTETIVNMIFDIIPDKNISKYQLFAFTKKEGVHTLGNSVQTGNNHYTISLAGSDSKYDTVYLLEIKPEINIAEKFSKKDPENPEDFYRYNIPSKANVCIKTSKGDFVNNQICYLPQYGTIGYIKTNIPKNTFDIDGSTGALQSLTIQRNALIGPDKVDAVSGLVDKVKTLTDKDQKEIDRLKKVKEKLELQKAIEKLNTGGDPDQ